MRLTTRDGIIVRDVALSHVLARDHLIALHFGSLTRANTRLKALTDAGFLRRLETPFYGQSLYVPGRMARQVVGPTVERLLRGRAGSPRFVRHALAVASTRVRLTEGGKAAWRFEQQATTTFQHAGREWEVRPDGLAVRPSGEVLAVEVDLSHASARKVAAKFRAYEQFWSSGACRKAWQTTAISVLVVTTGRLRAARLSRLVPDGCPVPILCRTHEEIGVAFPGAFS